MADDCLTHITVDHDAGKLEIDQPAPLVFHGGSPVPCDQACVTFGNRIHISITGIKIVDDVPK